MTPRRGKPKGFPWAWLMREALRMGISAAEFWRMTPRGILLLQREEIRARRPAQLPGRPGRGEPARKVRLSYLPRP